MSHSSLDGAAAKSHPRPIAPATAKPSITDSEHAAMPFNCETCKRRKVKCDKSLPVCSTCRRCRLECLYRAPLSRKRKRRPQGDVSDRLARYETILESNGLLPEPLSSHSPSLDLSAFQHPQELASTAHRPSPASGKLVSARGKSRFLDSVLLLPAGHGDLCELSQSDTEQEDPDNDAGTTDLESSGSLGRSVGEIVHLAMLGSFRKVTKAHPSAEHALELWNIYLQNVESLCKMIHVPSVSRMVSQVSSNPSTASRADECLLFSIYYFAVFTVSNEECLQVFGQARAELMTKYQRAFLQTLVNVSWLRTTSLRVLQAYVLFLLAMRSQIDPDTFWSLTGMAMRIAQRMGLHRDGEGLGLPPYDVQMRRRLFWQLLPLDSYAGQISGTGILLAPESWDTKQPLNINDDELYPGMDHVPCEQNGATEMIFCLAKAELSNFYNRTSAKLKGAAASAENAQDVEKLIDDVEGRIESRYLRYCDIIQPLHLLTLGVVRSAANVVRLRNRMAPLMDKSLPDRGRKDLCVLAQKILDTDNAMYSNPLLKGFHWSIRSFFLWDAVLCILFGLCKDGFFSRADVDAHWKIIGQVFANHEEVLARRRALHATICDASLKAWSVNPTQMSIPEPSFITAIRDRPKDRTNRVQGTLEEVGSSDGGGGGMVEDKANLEGLFGSENESWMTMGTDLGFDPSDWLSWDPSYLEACIG